MSTFDAAAFENAVIEGSNETDYTPLPEGQYSPCAVDSVRIKGVQRENGSMVPVLEVTYQLLEPSDKVKELMAKEGGDGKITVRQDVWLDVNENGALTFGPNQNVALGRIREACKMNDPKKRFQYKMLEGAGPLKLTIGIREDKNTEAKYNRIQKVERYTNS